ncbi:MAG: hypothetical protein H7Y07_02610 [Pyrinomonadaceae bacterium]|nr:hypothetical protein [Sphingobacteriaceae bacterium]
MKLLFFVAYDLQINLDYLDEYVEREDINKEFNEDYNRFILQIKQLIDSSQLVFKDLAVWSESQLLGDPIYTSGLRFQTQTVISLVKNALQHLEIINNVKDIAGLRFNLSLFRFVLNELLRFSIQYCNAESIEISSYSTQKEIIISIGVVNASFLRVSNILKTQKDADAEPGKDILAVCYTLLNSSGGNLWSNCSLTSGLNLYFSIPI